MTHLHVRYTNKIYTFASKSLSTCIQHVKYTITYNISRYAYYMILKKEKKEKKKRYVYYIYTWNSNTSICIYNLCTCTDNACMKELEACSSKKERVRGLLHILKENFRLISYFTQFPCKREKRVKRLVWGRGNCRNRGDRKIILEIF